MKSMFVTALETQMSTLETSKGRVVLGGGGRGGLQLLLHLKSSSNAVCLFVTMPDRFLF